MTTMTRSRTLHNLHKIEIDVGELGSTVRLGNKWSDAVPETRINLCECASGCATDGHDEDRDCVVVGAGEIRDQWFGSFAEVPARLIANEHELASRDYYGLLNSMKRAYGGRFNEDDRVTILVYRRVS